MSFFREQSIRLPPEDSVSALSKSIVYGHSLSTPQRADQNVSVAVSEIIVKQTPFVYI